MSTKHFILFLLAALTVTLSPFIVGYYYGTGDTQDVYLPLEHFFRTEQLAGRLPLWHPDVAWGFPVLASAQIGFFYPPLLLLRFLPASIYLPLLFTLQIALAAFSTFALARKLQLSPSASYLAAISFSLSAWLWQHATHLNIIITATWLPLQLLAAHNLAASGRAKAKPIVWLAIALALPFLGGQMHIPVMSAVITAWYVLYRYWRNHRHILTPLGLVAIVSLLAFGLSAAQLLPTAELASYSSRTSEFSTAQANQYSFPLYHLPTTLFPRFFDSDNSYWGKRLEIEYGIFFGTIPLLLALFAIRRAHRRLPFFLYLGLVSWLLALGSASPFRLIGFEPSLWFFSAPARWLLFTTLSGSLLAGLGFDLLIKQAATFQRYLSRVFIVVLLASALTTGLLLLLPTNAPESIYQQVTTYASSLLGEKSPSYYLDKITQIITSARNSSVSLLSFYTALPLVILLVSIVTRAKKWWPAMLLGLATVELVIIAGTANPLIPWSTITAAPATVAKLPPPVLQKQARLMTTTSGGDTGALLTNPATKADLASRLKARELLPPLRHSQFGIAGVEWPASLDLPELTKASSSLRPKETDSTTTYSADLIKLAEARNIGALLIHPDRAQPAKETSYQTEQALLYTLTPAPRASFIAGGATTPVPYRQTTPTSISFNVSAASAGLLIVRDTFYPGWQSFIDGQPVELQRVEDIFRAVPVPAGDHTITMNYRPFLSRLGLAVTLATILLCSLLLLVRRRTRPS